MDIIEAQKIWIAPTNENKECFLNTLRCMKYSERELKTIKEEDFSTYFKCTLGEPPFIIDILTIIHKNIDFDEAGKQAVVHQLQNGIVLKMIPYDFLKEAKLLSRRPKDISDITRLEELRKPE